MTTVEIYNRNGWRVVSLGNGWGYELIDDENKASAWFQDEDAREFAQHVFCPEDGFFADNCEDRFADYSEVMQPM